MKKLSVVVAGSGQIRDVEQILQVRAADGRPAVASLRIIIRRRRIIAIWPPHRRQGALFEESESPGIHKIAGDTIAPPVRTIGTAHDVIDERLAGHR